MSLQFSRSLRSLNLDSFKASRLGLILAVINMIILLIWFFSARVTLYEVSSDLELMPNGEIVATFEPESMNRLSPGQPALLRIDAGPDQALITNSALLIGVDRKNKTGEFLVTGEDIPDNIISEGISGKAEVEVEVEYVSPATLVLRASGKFLNRGEIPVSPGNSEETGTR